MILSNITFFSRKTNKFVYIEENMYICIMKAVIYYALVSILYGSGIYVIFQDDIKKLYPKIKKFIKKKFR